MPTGILVAVGSTDYEKRVLDVEKSGVAVVRRCVDVADLLATAAARVVDVAVISLGLRGIDADVVDRMMASGVSVVGIARDADEAALLRQLGVDEVVELAELDRLPQAIADAVADAEAGDAERVGRSSGLGSLGAQDDREAVEEPRKTSGQVLAVWGPTGAPGRTTIAVNLAAELASRGRRVLLVDADVYGGTVAAMLGLLDESSGLLAAARAANAGVLTPALLGARARSVGNRLEVLTGLPRADRWTELKPVLLSSILRSARARADVVVVDCGFSLELDEELSYDTAAPRRNGATLTILEDADEIAVVGSADPIGLARLVRAVDELGSVIPQSHPRIIVNRTRAGLPWRDGELAATVERALGVAPYWLLPDDPAACDRALVAGRSVVEIEPGSRLSRSIADLATALTGVAPAIGRSWRDRLAKKRTPVAARHRVG